MNSSQLDILQIILQSGIIVQGVLLLLLLASILSWGTIIMKFLQFRKVVSENEDFLEHYSNRENLKEMIAFSRDESESLFANIYLEGTTSLAKLKSRFSAAENSDQLLNSHLKIHGLSTVERALKKAETDVLRELEDKLSFLASIGSVSPFVGLFGTVWGIIHSFTGLSSGSATLAAVAPGIAEALVATAVGLFAAIPAVWFYNKFTNMIQHFQSEMDSFSLDFLNVIERTLVSMREN